MNVFAKGKIHSSFSWIQWSHKESLKKLLRKFVKSASVCDTWEEQEQQEEEQEQETRTSLFVGNLVVVGHTPSKVIVVKKQKCKKFLLKINMHGSLLASLLASCLLKT